jgi:transcription termination factor NusB
MSRPSNHHEMSPYAKYETFKKAFDEIALHKNSKNYLAAHVLAFSILEDRVTASYVLCFRAINKFNPPNYERLHKVPFKQFLDYLLGMGALDENLHGALTKAAHKRNELLHQAMWRLSAFNLKNVDDVRNLINEVQKTTRKFVKTHGAKELLTELAE